MLLCVQLNRSIKSKVDIYVQTIKLKILPENLHRSRSKTYVIGEIYSRKFICFFPFSSNLWRLQLFSRVVICILWIGILKRNDSHVTALYRNIDRWPSFPESNEYVWVAVEIRFLAFLFTLPGLSIHLRSIPSSLWTEFPIGFAHTVLLLVHPIRLA